MQLNTMRFSVHFSKNLPCLLLLSVLPGYEEITSARLVIVNT